jgi:hypothetical protein
VPLPVVVVELPPPLQPEITAAMSIATINAKNIDVPLFFIFSVSFAKRLL